MFHESIPGVGEAAGFLDLSTIITNPAAPGPLTQRIEYKFPKLEIRVRFPDGPLPERRIVL